MIGIISDLMVLALCLCVLSGTRPLITRWIAGFVLGLWIVGFIGGFMIATLEGMPG